MTKTRIKWRKPGELVHIQLPPSFCPSCFKMLDGVTGMQEKEVPGPGDFTICIECAAVLEYDGDMQLILRSLMDIPMHSRLAFAQAVTEIKNRR